jgi:hypothetical protein
VTLIVVTAASAATTAKSLSAAATTTAAAGLVCLWFRLVNFEGAASKLGAVQRRNRFVRFRRIGHFDKGETAGAAGFTIGDNAYAFDGAMRFKHAAQFRFSGAVRQIANIQILHDLPFSRAMLPRL